MPAAKKNGKGNIKLVPKTKNGANANKFAAIEAMDGNPQSIKEFDEIERDEKDYFFRNPEDATQEEKHRVLILNYIHKRLRGVTDRLVPAQNDKNLEIYHRDTFEGVDVDICVYWPPREDGEYKACFAMVKLSSILSADIEPYTGREVVPTDQGNFNGAISADSAWSKGAQTDPKTVVLDKLVGNFWTPRWKYVKKSLIDRLANFDKYGVEIYREPEPTVEPETNGHAEDPNEEIEAGIMIYSGSVPSFFKVKKLFEIKDNCHLISLQAPPKVEGPDRPKARELVPMMAKGTRANVEKAKVLILEFSEAWRGQGNTRRNNTDSGYGSSDAPAYGNGSTDNYPSYNPTEANGNGGDWDNQGSSGNANGETWVGDAAGGGAWDGATGGGGDWAAESSAAAEAAEATAVGGGEWGGAFGGTQW